MTAWQQLNLGLDSGAWQAILGGQSRGTLAAKQLTNTDFGTRVRTPNGFTGTTQGQTEYGESYVAVSLDINKLDAPLSAFPISQLTIIDGEDKTMKNIIDDGT